MTTGVYENSRCHLACFNVLEATSSSTQTTVSPPLIYVYFRSWFHYFTTVEDTFELLITIQSFYVIDAAESLLPIL